MKMVLENIRIYIDIIEMLCVMNKNESAKKLFLPFLPNMNFFAKKCLTF